MRVWRTDRIEIERVRTSGPSLADARPDQLAKLPGHLVVGNSFPLGELTLRKLDVAKNLKLFYQGFVVRDAQEHRGTLAVLGQDQGTPRLTDLLDERGGVCPEGRERLDVLGRLDGRHGSTPEGYGKTYSLKYVAAPECATPETPPEVGTSLTHSVLRPRPDPLAFHADTALRLARYFKTSDRFWLNLQTSYDLDVARDRLGSRLAEEVPVCAG
jgi:hypothetical protein